MNKVFDFDELSEEAKQKVYDYFGGEEEAEEQMINSSRFSEDGTYLGDIGKED